MNESNTKFVPGDLVQLVHNLGCGNLDYLYNWRTDEGIYVSYSMRQMMSDPYEVQAVDELGKYPIKIRNIIKDISFLVEPKHLLHL